MIWVVMFYSYDSELQYDIIYLWNYLTSIATIGPFCPIQHSSLFITKNCFYRKSLLWIAPAILAVGIPLHGFLVAEMIQNIPMVLPEAIRFSWRWSTTVIPVTEVNATVTGWITSDIPADGTRQETYTIQQRQQAVEKRFQISTITFG